MKLLRFTTEMVEDGSAFGTIEAVLQRRAIGAG